MSPTRRVFVCSTGKDLEEHRRSVFEQIGRLEQFAIKMEEMGARPERPLKECQRLASEADALVVFVAHCYGWVPPEDQGGDGQTSISWHEVKAARAAGKPVFAFVVDPDTPWSAQREQDRLVTASDRETALSVWRAVQLLDEFMLDLKTVMIVTFSFPEDLGARVATALSNWRAEQAGAPAEPGLEREPPQRTHLALPRPWRPRVPQTLIPASPRSRKFVLAVLVAVLLGMSLVIWQQRFLGRLEELTPSAALKVLEGRHPLWVTERRARALWQRSDLTQLLDAAWSHQSETRRARSVEALVRAALPIPKGRTNIRYLAKAFWMLDRLRADFHRRHETDAARSVERTRRQLLSALWELRPRRSDLERFIEENFRQVPTTKFFVETAIGQRDLITVSPFRIQTHEVSVSEYRQFDPAHQARPGESDLPVVEVDWFESYLYSTWLGGRLPTATEWHVAATQDCPFAAGFCTRTEEGVIKPASIDEVAWYEENAGGRRREVQTRRPNQRVLFDLYGNVWEWVLDWHWIESLEERVDPWGPLRPEWSARIYLGGSYLRPAIEVDSTRRFGLSPNERSEDLGFRPVVPNW